MRVIFSSPPSPVVMTDPRNGASQDAQLRFELVLLEEGEDPTPPSVKARLTQAGSGPSGLGTHSLRSLRERAGGRPIEIPPPQDTAGAAPVIIPEGIVSGLPDTAAFLLRWQLTPRAQQ